MSTEQEKTPAGGQADSQTRRSMGQNTSVLSDMDSSPFNESFLSHAKYKEHLQQLNKRLAEYMSSVKFLTSENERLNGQLTTSQTNVTERLEKIQAKCQTEMKETSARRIAEIESTLECLKATHAAEIDETNRKLQESLQTIDRQGHEYKLLQHRYDTTKAALDKLGDTLAGIRGELERETLYRVKAERKCQKLEGQLLFAKEVHQWERKESVSVSSTADNRAYWDNRVEQAVKQIKDFYDAAVSNAKKEQEIYINKRMSYEKTIRDLMGENHQLKIQLQRYEMRRDEVDFGGSVQLDAEIAEYKMLLDRSACESIPCHATGETISGLSDGVVTSASFSMETTVTHYEGQVGSQEEGADGSRVQQGIPEDVKRQSRKRRKDAE